MTLVLEVRSRGPQHKGEHVIFTVIPYMSDIITECMTNLFWSWVSYTLCKKHLYVNILPDVETWHHYMGLWSKLHQFTGPWCENVWEPVTYELPLSIDAFILWLKLWFWCEHLLLQCLALCCKVYHYNCIFLQVHFLATYLCCLSTPHHKSPKHATHTHWRQKLSVLFARVTPNTIY